MPDVASPSFYLLGRRSGSTGDPFVYITHGAAPLVAGCQYGPSLHAGAVDHELRVRDGGQLEQFGDAQLG